MRKAAETNPREGAKPGLEVRRDGSRLLLVLSGEWKLRSGVPGVEPVEEGIRGGETTRLEFEADALGGWDSALLNFALKCHALCREREVDFGGETLPRGVQKLLGLALAVPEATDAHRSKERAPLLERMGRWGMRSWDGLGELVSFVGSSFLAAMALLRGAAQFRWRDALVVIQRAGPEAFGVVALINFLVGVILAFVGAVQLSRFGAAIFVADLVAIGTVREMGCLMTGIIVCGRTGAAFAAELGAMKANEEISAFRTFGISPMEFLVLPRILGLFLMMPLLTVFADVIAIAGGFLVSITLLDVTMTEYLRRTVEAITLTSFLLGVFKGAVFGIIVAVFGCLRGMQSGDNAAAVGQATTSAVVSGITSIVAADGIFAVLCDALGI